MLHAEGETDPKQAISVVADVDGVARFPAVRAAPGDAVTRLSLDCVTATGQKSAYSVDLSSDATFAARPFDPSQLPGPRRPALAGDPLAYSQADLVRQGYGLRPDPETHPRAYARWLKAANRQARSLRVERPVEGAQTSPIDRPAAVPVSAPRQKTIAPDDEQAGTSGNWTGAILTGAPKYMLVEAEFVIPTPVPGGFGTAGTQEAIWAGIGGASGSGGLTQPGLTVFTTSSSYQIWSFFEYCCGIPNVPATNLFQYAEGGSGVGPYPGDTIYLQTWYCDATGQYNDDVNAGGGYACANMQDENPTTGWVLNCTSPTGAEPNGDQSCVSVPPLPNFVLGKSAEFVMELQGSSFSAFTGPLSMSGSAVTPSTTDDDLNTDPSVLVDEISPGASTLPVAVSLTAPDTVNWDVSPFAPPPFPTAPNCSYTGIAANGNEGTLSIDCNGNETVFIFQQINGSWQPLTQTVAAGPTQVTEPQGASLTLVGCSVTSWWGYGTGAQSDTAPAAPGDIGCDPTATTVQIPVLTCPSGWSISDGICCPSNQHNSEGHCCPTGDIWSSTANKCVLGIRNPCPQCGKL